MDRAHPGRDTSLPNRFYELIVEQAPACIALLRGPSFVHEFVNPAYASTVPGIRMEGKAVEEVFPEVAPLVLPLLKNVLETGEPYRVEDASVQIPRIDGVGTETRFFSFSYTRIADGNASGAHAILVIAIENTARKNAEQATELALADLKKQWRTFDTALSNTPDFAYIFDLQGRVIYANYPLLTLWQMTLEAVIGRNFYDLKYPPELAGRLQDQIQQVIERKQLLRDRTPFTGPTGETRHYEYIFAPVFAADGKVEAVVGSTRDITDQKHAEEQEHARQFQLRESARLESLGVMAGGVAHDFNNLLVGVLGNASLLVDSVGEQDVPIASAIVLAAERAAALTKQMLAYSGKGRFVIEVVDLNSIVRENLTLLSASFPRRVNVKLDLTDPCLVEADRTQIHQVIMNLLINSAEAIGDKSGTVAIRTTVVERKAATFSPRLHTTVPPGTYASVEIQDDGAGMGTETLRKIFDPFFTTKFTGRGLGLAAVLGIVKGHNGDIDVASTPGAGTVFRVFLPQSGRAVAVQHKPEQPPQALSHRTVLVVDDEAMVRNVATLALRRAGLHVVTAENGSHGIDILKVNRDISLVILDLTMPGMTGEEALPLMQSLRPEVPVILSSGFSEEEISRRFSSSVVAGVLEKPYTAAAISAKVIKVLKLASDPA